MIGLLAETNIHVGVGQSVGALDLPVARERTTHYPFIPGSGVKGAFRVWAGERAGLDEGRLTGLLGKKTGGQRDDGKKEDQAAPDDGDDRAAGKLLLSDARLLLLPVRSLSSAYRWVTCSIILDRLVRDAARTDDSVLGAFRRPAVQPKKYLGAGGKDEILGLEEREFKRAGDLPEGLIPALSAVLPDRDMAARLAERLVVLHDDDFVWFARYALPVIARNRLNEDKVVDRGGLWYEESLPSDTVMYLLLGERAPGQIKSLTEAVTARPYIQMGGNETIGQGWFKMAWVGAAS